MLNVSPVYTPPMIKGLTIDQENPLHFQFIIDTGNEQYKDNDQLREESTRLIKYFLASLTVPENEMWVNLSPHEKDRIIPDGFGQTEMGRDLLAQDYILKQLTASLIYPEKELGAEFWKKVHDRAWKEFKTKEIPLDTFNKVWIVPEKAVIYEHERSAYVLESHLKVMLEEDYQALISNTSSTSADNQKLKDDNRQLTASIMKEIIIPEIEREVNEGKNFTNLRQIYQSMILATWYKMNLKESLLGQIYVDQNKLIGIDLDDKNVKDKIYAQYIEAFKKGVYNYIKEDYDPDQQKTVPRQYISGGFSTVGKDNATLVDLVGREIIKSSAGYVSADQYKRISKGLKPSGDQFRTDVQLLENGNNGIINADQSMLVKIDDALQKNPSQKVHTVKGYTPAGNPIEDVLTYQDISDQSNQFAHVLKNAGIEKGDRVAVMSPVSGLEMIASLGIWKAGAVRVPFKTQWTSNEIKKYLTQTTPEAMVILNVYYDQHLLSILNEFKDLKVYIISSGETISSTPHVMTFQNSLINQTTDFLNISSDPRDLVQLAISTGTTGESKIVKQTQENFYFSTQEYSEWLDDAPQGPVVSTLPPGTYGSHSILGTVLRGRPLYIVPRLPKNQTTDEYTQTLSETLKRTNAKILFGVPTQFQALAMTGEKFPGLIGLSRGAALRDVKQLFESVTGGRVIEGYGLTEGTSSVTNPINRDKPGTVGIPSKDTTFKVINPSTQKELPIGEEGELVLKGPQVMAGYWEDPVGTKAAFTEDGFLRTGDLGSIDKDGYIKITGRLKDIIISGGDNVIPSEVEKIIKTNAAIEEVTVVGISDPGRFPDDPAFAELVEHWGEVVVAFVVPKKGMNTLNLEPSIREFAKKNLAAYKVPKKVVVLNKLPLLGDLFKIDRQQLIRGDNDNAVLVIPSAIKNIENIKAKLVLNFMINETLRNGLISQIDGEKLIPSVAIDDEQITVAKKVSDEEYELSGTKAAVVNGGRASFYIVFAQLNGKSKAFLVDNPKGITKKSVPTMGLAENNIAQVQFNRVRAKLITDNLDDSEILKAVQNKENKIIRALAISEAQRIYKMGEKYAAERRAFGQSINKFPSLKRLMDGIQTDVENINASPNPTAMLVDIANRVLQIFAARGFENNTPAVKIWREAQALHAIVTYRQSLTKTTPENISLDPEEVFKKGSWEDFGLTPDQISLKSKIRNFAENIVAPMYEELDRDGQYPLSILKKMGDAGITKPGYPKEVGGEEADTLSWAIVVEELVKAAPAFGIFSGVPHTASVPILKSGTPEQKEIVAQVVRGEIPLSYGQSEPHSGSDVGGIKTTAHLTKRDGVEGYVINGEKIWIGSATVAPWLVLLAKTGEATDRDLNKFAFFLVPFRDQDGKFQKGIEVHEMDLLGMRGIGNSHIIMKDVFIPKENILGEVGKGFKTAMHAMDSGRIFVSSRGLGVISHAVENAKEALKEALRENPNLPHAQNYISQIDLMEAERLSVRAMLQKTSDMNDRGKRMTYETAIMKWIAGEVAADIAQRSYDLIHTISYNPSRWAHSERVLRDSRQIRIGEGTPQIMQRIAGLKIRRQMKKKLTHLSSDIILQDALKQILDEKENDSVPTRLNILFNIALAAYLKAIKDGQFDITPVEPYGIELDLANLEALRMRVNDFQKMLTQMAQSGQPFPYGNAVQIFMNQKYVEAETIVHNIFTQLSFKTELEEIKDYAMIASLQVEELRKRFKETGGAITREEAQQIVKGAKPEEVAVVLEQIAYQSSLYGPVNDPAINRVDPKIYESLIGIPGQAPFVRGLFPSVTQRAAGRWPTVRRYGSYGTAEESNANLKKQLEAGVTGFSIAFDLPTQNGYDTGHPLAVGEAGRVGIAINTLQDMEDLFDGLPLEKISTSMTINPTAPILFAMYVAAARKKGVPDKLIAGSVQNDSLKEYTARNTYVLPYKGMMRMTTDVFRWTKDNLPRFNTITISGYHIRESNVDAVKEIAFTITNALQYVAELKRKGLSRDEIAGSLATMAWFINLKMNTFEEVGKLRALRRVWSKIVRDGLGIKPENVTDPKLKDVYQKATNARVATWSGGSEVRLPYATTLNFARNAIRAFNAPLSGVQSWDGAAFDESIGIPTDFAQEEAMLRLFAAQSETGLMELDDPFGGSYFLEAETNRIEQGIWNELSELSQKDSFLDVLQFMVDERTRLTDQDRIDLEGGQRKIVGYNISTDGADAYPQPKARPMNTENFDVKQGKRLKKVLETRDNDAVQSALDELEKALKNETENVLPYIFKAVEVYATVGEISDRMRRIYGASDGKTPWNAQPVWKDLKDKEWTPPIQEKPEIFDQDIRNFIETQKNLIGNSYQEIYDRGIARGYFLAGDMPYVRHLHVEERPGEYPYTRGIIKQRPEKLNNISGYLLREAGMDGMQELALSLFAAKKEIEKGNTPSERADIANQIRIVLSSSDNFMEETARIFLARRMWAEMLKEMGITDENALQLIVGVKTDATTYTEDKHWLNISRGTRQAYQAYLAGVDPQDIIITRFDAPYGHTDQTRLAEQIAKDTLDVFRYELPKKVQNPLSGMFALEAKIETMEGELKAELTKLEDLSSDKKSISISAESEMKALIPVTNVTGSTGVPTWLTPSLANYLITSLLHSQAVQLAKVTAGLTPKVGENIKTSSTKYFPPMNTEAMGMKLLPPSEQVTIDALASDSEDLRIAIADAWFNQAANLYTKLLGALHLNNSNRHITKLLRGLAAANLSVNAEQFSKIAEKWSIISEGDQFTIQTDNGSQLNIIRDTDHQGKMGIELAGNVSEIMRYVSQYTLKNKMTKKDKLRILVAKPGLDGHDVGARTIANGFRDAGFDVIYTGLQNTPEQIVETARQENIDVIGLSILSNAHNSIGPKVASLLNKNGMDDVFVAMGGMIPDDDQRNLFRKSAVNAIYIAGTTMQKIVDDINHWNEWRGKSDKIKITNDHQFTATLFDGSSVEVVVINKEIPTAKPVTDVEETEIPQTALAVPTKLGPLHRSNIPVVEGVWSDDPEIRNRALQHYALAGDILLEQVIKTSPVLGRFIIPVSNAVSPHIEHATVASAGIALTPEHFEQAWEANGNPHRSNVPEDVRAEEFEVIVTMPDGSKRILDILRDKKDDFEAGDIVRRKIDVSHTLVEAWNKKAKTNPKAKDQEAEWLNMTIKQILNPPFASNIFPANAIVIKVQNRNSELDRGIIELDQELNIYVKVLDVTPFNQQTVDGKSFIKADVIVKDKEENILIDSIVTVMKPLTIARHINEYSEAVIQQVEVWTDDIQAAHKAISAAAKDKTNGINVVLPVRDGANGTKVFFTMVTIEGGVKVLVELIQNPKAAVDNASLSQYGGIDLNPAHLDLQIKRDGRGIPLPVNQQPIINMHIDGFYPIIIEMTPVNLPMLLGFADENMPADETDDYSQSELNAREPEDLSYLN